MNGEMLYHIRDITNNIIGLLDSNNQLVASYSYDAFGNVLTKDGTYASKNPILYKGYYYEHTIRLYYLVSRYYDPYIRRFISPDSIDYLEPTSFDGLNLYVYCGNSPIMYSDPSGHFALFLAGLSLLDYILLATGILLIVSSIILSANKFKNDYSQTYENNLIDTEKIYLSNQMLLFIKAMNIMCYPICINTYLMAIKREHRITKNGKGRTKIIHEKGQRRKLTDEFGGEKGDKNRYRMHKRYHLWWILFLTKRDDENEEYYW